MSDKPMIEYDPEMTWYQVYCLSRAGQPVTLSEKDGERLVAQMAQGGNDGWFECQTVHGCPCHFRLASIQQIIKSDYETRCVQYAWAEASKAQWEAKTEEDKRLWRESMHKFAAMAEKASDEMGEGDAWKDE